MSDALLGGLVAVCIALAIEGYVLIGRAQLLLTHAEQLLAAATRLLAQVPGKTAPRTEAADDVQPHRWWQRLYGLTAPELLDPATEPIPAVADTAPVQRVIEEGLKQVTGDPVEAALARFSYAAGHRAGTGQPPQGGAQ